LIQEFFYGFGLDASGSIQFVTHIKFTFS